MSVAKFYLYSFTGFGIFIAFTFLIVYYRVNYPNSKLLLFIKEKQLQLDEVFTKKRKENILLVIILLIIILAISSGGDYGVYESP